MLLLIILGSCARLNLLAGIFYLSPFLCKFLADSGCLLFVAVCVYLWFPHPRKKVTSLSFPSFHHLFSSFFFLYPCFLDPAVFPSGCCSSALKLSCWKCQKLAFSSCRVIAVSLMSSMCFLFTRRNHVGLGLFLGGRCVFAEEMFVSQKKHCCSLPLSKINRQTLPGFALLFALFTLS